MSKGMQYKCGISSVPMSILVQVKHIISMNKIQSAGKAHHQMLEKGGTYTLYNTLARYFMLLMNCTCL